MPIPLVNLSGLCADGEIHFKWKLPPGPAPEMLYIYPITGTTVDTASRTLRRLQSDPYSARLPCPQGSGEGVSVYLYLLFLAELGEALPPLESLLGNPAYTTTVITGRAAVGYQPKLQRLDGGVFRHSLIIESDSKLPPEALHYVFYSLGQRFSAPLPGEINKGKTSFEPFHTFGEAQKTSLQATEGITVTEKKLSWF